jgi:6-phosphogluconate dehydrogenase
MQIGLVGLGRMGGNIVRRLMRDGHSVVVFDRSADAVKSLAGEGATASSGLADAVTKLAAPRTIWIMLPAGAATEQAIDDLAAHLSSGDTIIDGGNTFWRDDIARAKKLAPKGIHYVDVGTSGGIWGLERGYCMMIGGEKAVVDRLDPIFKTLAPGIGDIPKTKGREGRDPRAESGYIHAGPTGAGHFVKMVHNGIEYGLMQAYAEGLDILQHAGDGHLAEADGYKIDLADVTEVWRRGSVISSWLLDLSATALAENTALSDYSGRVEDSGEGRWTLQAAIEEGVPTNVLSAALYARFQSRDPHSFAMKVLSAMRKGFGGHVEVKGS